MLPLEAAEEVKVVAHLGLTIPQSGSQSRKHTSAMGFVHVFNW